MDLKVKINLIFLTSILFLVACSGQQRERKKPKLKNILTHNTAKNDSLVNALGYQLESSIYESEVDFFSKKFNLDRFNQLSTYTEFEDEETKEYKKEFIKGFSKGFNSLPEKIVNTIEDGGFYDFINYYYDSDTKTYRMLFRLFSEEEGINYHDFHLVPIAGEFQIQDIYIYLTGENLSETANKIFLMSMPKNLFKKIISGGNSKDMNHFLKAVYSQKANENQSALEQLNLVQGDIRHLKIYHVIKILVASNLDDSIYMTALQDMQKDFKDDPTCYLLSVDYHIMKEEYDKAIEAIEKLQKDTGDNFLNYLKGNIALTGENYKDAIRYFEDVIEEYPTYDSPKFSLISSYNGESNYPACVMILNQILDNEIYTPAELIEFVESEEEDGTNSLLPLKDSKAYKNWKTRQLAK